MATQGIHDKEVEAGAEMSSETEKNLSDDQIINKLADQLLIYINVASGVSKLTSDTMCKKTDGRPMARLPGVDVCVFVAHASSKAKVYTGPMLFNRFNLMTKVPAQGEYIINEAYIMQCNTRHILDVATCKFDFLDRKLVSCTT
ncbi:hypothetical protein Tcan_05457 [Toxocara canis]|uniref:Uncharacterized protein n=1 Tax=Toxocara canis TaxID=6265 RepID=A0A0B2VAV1_TOXCA|nr:hypothetical protein Tcan_05457 [Toxocara canis]